MTRRQRKSQAGKVPDGSSSRPRRSQALLGDAVAHHRAGRVNEAAAIYRRILQTDPRNADALHLLGLASHQTGDAAGAQTLIEQAIAISAGNPAYHNSLGTVLLAENRFVEAEACFLGAIDRDPGLAEAWNNLGNTRLRLNRPESAIDAYRKALECRPDYAEAHGNMGSALRELNRLDDAEACYRQAIRCNPRYATAHSNLGRLLHELARYDDALASLDRALALDPGHADAHANRAVVLLLLGRFAEGWAEYEWRWKVSGFTTARRNFSQPRWDGSDLDGRTLLLHAEQGLGSAIQFARYAPIIAKRGGRVLLECQRPLARLFSSLLGVDLVVKGEPLPSFDVQAPLMSVPGLLRTRGDSIPADVPYLAADASAAAGWRERLGSAKAPRIGLVWSGNPRHLNDRNRSMPAGHLAPLLTAGIGCFYGLQVGATAEDIARLPAGTIIDCGPELGDFADTAAAVAALDLVISVDTAVAHLAGALARPVWLLLPFVPEWRWQLEREDTPWYPTMRLFRQRSPGGWVELIERVGVALSAADPRG